MISTKLALQILLTLLLASAAFGALWVGEFLWFLFVIICGLGVAYEFWHLVDNKKNLKIFLFSFDNIIYLVLCFLYIAFACYNALMWRAESFEDTLLILIFIASANSMASFGRYLVGKIMKYPVVESVKINMIGKSDWSLNHEIYKPNLWTSFIISTTTPALIGFLYSGKDLMIFFGAIVGLCAFGGNAMVWFLKEDSAIKNSNRLIPNHAGVLDRLGGYLLAFFFAVATLSAG